MLRKVIGWGIVAMLMFWMFTSPGGAAGAVHSAFHGLATAGASLGSFVKAL